MSEHNIFRDGKIHVLADECATCIFKPHVRPVDGARVAGMILDTKDEDGATVPCHNTLYDEGVDNAICRGWYDRFAHRDGILQVAERMGVIEYDPVPEKNRG